MPVHFLKLPSGQCQAQSEVVFYFLQRNYQISINNDLRSRDDERIGLFGHTIFEREEFEFSPIDL